MDDMPNPEGEDWARLCFDEGGGKSAVENYQNKAV
jgi:hypothetical protein